MDSRNQWFSIFVRNTILFFVMPLGLHFDQGRIQDLFIYPWRLLYFCLCSPFLVCHLILDLYVFMLDFGLLSCADMHNHCRAALC